MSTGTKIVKSALFLLTFSDIVSINRELSGIKKLRGLTLFGRNDLFWFAFDSFGTCMMLDNLNLGVLRKYDNPYRAMSDCLLGGKF